MLLIEGADMLGKTILSAEVVKVLSARAGRVVGADKFGLPESSCMVQSCRDRLKPWTVFDRGWPSEVVYGQRCRPKPQVSPIEAGQCQALAEAAGCLTVVIYADDEVYDELVKTWWHRGEAFTQQQCRAVNEAYRHLAASGRLGDYTVRVDLAHCVERVGGQIVYPAQDPKLVSRICDAYMERQLLLEGAAP